MSDLLGRHQPFRAADARAAGLSSRALRAAVERGDLIALSRGIYLPSHSDIDPDLAEIAIKAPEATICLTSALAHHGLIDTIPSAWDLAQPRNAYRPRTVAAVAWHEFDAVTFDYEREHETIRGVRIAIYSPERSIADAFRLRGYEGYETAVKALRTWLETRGGSPAHLLDIAKRLPRTESPLRHALETLL